MKTTPRRVFALMLALILLLSLCACGQKEQTVPDEPKMSTDKVDLLTKADKKTPERQPEEAISQSDMSDRVSRDEATETQPVQYGFSQEAETSLGWLRDRIDVTGVMFGAAYLGYVGGLFDEGFEAGFPAWLWETNEAMLLKYPFIAEIDEEHIIGGAGHLYCIVPVDENATLAINRVQWNEKTQTDEVTEVLYRSESGEPVWHTRRTHSYSSPTATIPTSGIRVSTRKADLRRRFRMITTSGTLRSIPGSMHRRVLRSGLLTAGVA